MYLPLILGIALLGLAGCGDVPDSFSMKPGLNIILEKPNCEDRISDSAAPILHVRYLNNSPDTIRLPALLISPEPDAGNISAGFKLNGEWKFSWGHMDLVDYTPFDDVVALPPHAELIIPVARVNAPELKDEGKVLPVRARYSISAYDFLKTRRIYKETVVSNLVRVETWNPQPTKRPR